VSDDGELRFAAPLPAAFVRRVVTVAPGASRRYLPAEWADALVVVEQGELELEGWDGRRQRLRRGDVLWLARLPLRALHNPGGDDAVLVAVARAVVVRDRRGDEVGERQPAVVEALGPGGAVLPWDEARTHLRRAGRFWLGTTGPGGGPHLAPVLAVWHAGALQVRPDPAFRRAGQLDARGRCALAAEDAGVRLVVDGRGRRLRHDVWSVRPCVVSAFGADPDFPATRWRF